MLVSVNIYFFVVMVNQFLQQLWEGVLQTSWLEFVAVIFGIISVVFSRKENILVYPTGIINTTLFIYLCFKWQLFAEASLNFYYTIMSFYGWYNWLKKKEGNALLISKSSPKQHLLWFGFFIFCWIILYTILTNFTKSNVPVADSFASATAYTAMLLMAKKKLEHWWWWIATNLVSIPLYYSKGAAFTSVQYVIFLLLAIAGLITWITKIKAQKNLYNVQ
ncbi:MAG: nicotinamide riboside transporter PnuC [Chitinophagaceae bacterium]